jgi:hypothetical protein
MIVSHLRTGDRVMRHNNGELVGIMILNLVDGRLEVLAHLNSLLTVGSVVDFLKGIKHNKVNQAREPHPLHSGVVTILN